MVETAAPEKTTDLPNVKFYHMMFHQVPSQL